MNEDRPNPATAENPLPARKGLSGLVKTVLVIGLAVLAGVFINYPVAIGFCFDVVFFAGMVLAIPVGIYYGTQKKFWT